ncbi:hypothetical protein M8J76_002494 [Diaphorina citri]|nr:hypothetical protein M8J76_002494 [Diaphorina citri]
MQVSLERCVIDCHSFLKQCPTPALNPVEQAFNQQYEQALEELEYLLDFNQYIKQESDALHDEVQDLLVHKTEPCVEKAVSVASEIPISEHVSEEIPEEKIEVSSIPSVHVIKQKKRKTEYEKLVDYVFNREQGNVLYRAKKKLKEIEIKIERMSMKINGMRADRKMYDTTRLELQKRNAEMMDKKFKALINTGIYKRHLQWFKQEKKRYLNRFKLNDEKMQVLKKQLRQQDRDKKNMERDMLKSSKMIENLSKENERQNKNLIYYLDKIKTVEAEIRELKLKMNCAASMKVFRFPNDDKIKKRDSPCSKRQRQKRTASKHGPAKSPDYLKQFKMELKKKQKHVVPPPFLMKTPVEKITNFVLKKKAAKNFPLQLKEEMLEEDRKHQNYRVVQLQNAEDRKKTKYFQLENELKKLVEYRKIWENKEEKLKIDTENMLIALNIKRGPELTKKTENSASDLLNVSKNSLVGDNLALNDENLQTIESDELSPLENGVENQNLLI